MPFRLPAGPLTVFDDLGNAGEAMVTTMATDVRQLVSFSIDGELKIRHEGKPETVESYALAFNKTRFLLDEKKQRLRVHQYSIENRSNHSKPLLLEHPKPTGGWTINPSGDFEEETDDATRYRLEIKAKVSRDFVLQETLSETSQHSFESLTVDKLQDWLDSPVINAATKNRVGELLAGARDTLGPGTAIPVAQLEAAGRVGVPAGENRVAGGWFFDFLRKSRQHRQG